MPKNQNKKKHRRPTIRQVLAVKHMVDNGGTAADALRAAGYSDAVVHTPSKVTSSRTFIDLLDDIGLTDNKLARAYDDLIHARKAVEKDFHAEEVWRQVGKRRRLVSYDHVADEEIKKIIESVRGSKLIAIVNYRHKKTAYFSTPELTSKKDGLNLAAKTKGLMAPEKHDHGIFHEATPEEKKLISEIFKANKL